MENEIIKNYLNKYSNELSECFLSCENIKIENIRNCMNNIVFNEINIMGKLLFINPCRIANWAHECIYIFISENEEIFEMIETWPPAEIIKLEQIF